ncbi:MAG: type I methionyl aminopeptidase [Candidatus Paceibacterota bacterium]
MIKLKSPQEIEMIADSGRILAKVFDKVLKEVKVGVSLENLDKLARRLIEEYGGQPAFLGYQPEGASHPYPASICASINDTVVHGLPLNYQLKSGDVLKFDFGVIYKNFYSDAAKTVAVGKVSKTAKLLIKATKKALEQAIKQAKPDNHLGDIGWAINQCVEKAGFKIIQGLTGHGIGFKLHEEPTVYNFGKKGEGIKLKPGMVLAIEPMTAVGSGRIIKRKDNSYVTADSSLSAHFEHTVAITKKGPRILTKL